MEWENVVYNFVSNLSFQQLQQDVLLVLERDVTNFIFLISKFNT
jgi:hypothetical protein